MLGNMVKARNLLTCCYCHAGRIPSPATSTIDLEVDDLEVDDCDDSVESSSKRMKTAKGIYHIVHGSVCIYGDINGSL